MRVGLLGPVEVQCEDGRALAPAGARPRALLARLALEPGSVLSRPALAYALWGDEPPAANALHTVVSRLRRSLAAEGDTLRSHPAGYALDVPPDAVDAVRAERLAAAAGERLGAGDPRSARELATEALALWRGEPLIDVDDAPFAVQAATRLADLRLRLEELAVDAALRTGDGVDLTELERLAHAHPTRERLQVLLVRAFHAAGRQADALAGYQRTRKLLADELGVDPSAELEQAYLAVLRDDGAHSARPVPVRSRLPQQITSFVGRHTELAEVADALRTSRLVTVVGPGGAGKTRLAAEAGRRVEPEYPDGAFFVQLAPVQDAAELPSVVLGALGLRERGLYATSDPPPTGEALDRLLDALANARLLLVLDNCEHLVDAAAHLTGTVLAGCPDVHVLATSREPLAITGEQLYPLPPLDVPPDDVTAADAASYAAVQLFTDRARKVRPRFRVTAGHVAAVAQICRRLDGMPLAVELAAARLRTMSPQQVADRLDDRFRLLATGSRTAMPRHQTLLAAVAWSWELLDGREQLLLARLAVFAGPVTLDDVEATCADDELPEASVVDVLGALVDKSLVDATGDGEVRYRLLETVRAYAFDRLVESGQAEEQHRRHARHVLQVARTADPLLRTGEQLHWLARLDGLREDVNAALRWSTERGEQALAAQLVASLGWYWTLRGMHTELQHWPSRTTTPPDGVDAEHYVVAGLYAVTSGLDGDTAEMRKTAEEFAARLRQLGHPPENPVAVLVEPAALMLRGDTAGSIERLTAIVDEHPDAWTRASARLMRSRLALMAGDGVTAANDEDELHETYRQVGDRWGLALAATFAADRAARSGETERALDWFRAALRQMHEMGALDDAAHTLVRMADVHAAAGQLEQARAVLQESERLPVQVTLHQPVHCAYRLARHADLARREGDTGEAVRLLTEALELSSSANTPPSSHLTAAMRLELGIAYVAGGGLDLAVEQLRRAWQVTEPTGDRSLTGEVVEGCAAWAAASGDAQLAARLLGMSQAVFGTATSPNLDRPALVRTAESALGTDAYRRCYAEGETYGHEAAVGWLSTWLQTELQTEMGPDHHPE